MASNTSVIFKLKGTIGELTFVKSRRYKPHVRRKRGTVKPAVLNEKMESSRQLLLSCNKHAKLIFDQLREEPRDGAMWSRLLKIIFHAAESGFPIDARLFQHLECNLLHPLKSITGEFGNYNKINVARDKKRLNIQVQLASAPKVPQKPFPGDYQLRLVVLFPDFENGLCIKKVEIGAPTSLKAALQPVEFSMTMPSATSQYLVFLQVQAIQKNRVYTSKATAALKVIASAGNPGK
ncbi:hypothetical protein [Paraflavitalea sp. CAU 1676]|uniref:hypothetical protein n=1 Tax=Paraflavitalea sp. CAU 1676 TaxID=3032598 RepID=UPI0023DB6F5C|nr:hypothetical protein [Paraflavitalea sp. CAU 1676]MDF2187348.1 hypothetical protein [Paraflavitalea sp. CAU 1676]